MALYKRLLHEGFLLPECEKHFHDHDETWIILQGRGTGYWIDPSGVRTEFALEAGDVWMVPVGYEHGSNGFADSGKNSDDFRIAVINGTEPAGCHTPGHYYVEQEGYLPYFELKKAPTIRYKTQLNLPAKMKGILFMEKGQAVLTEEETPGCAEGTVLCETLYSGLTNGTERNVLMGGNYGGNWPSRCGYQNVGRVLAVGGGVASVAVGDLVFSGDFQNHRQYFAAPATPGDLLVRLPDAVSLVDAALFGVASVALHDVRRAEVKLGERILVVGAGPIGQFTAQWARLVGAEVTVCDLDSNRLAMAAKLGAQHTMVPDDDWTNVRAAGPFDCVFEDSGAPILHQIIGATWENGQGVLKEFGRVVIIAGRNQVDYNFNAGQARQIALYQAGHFVADDLVQSCRLAAEGTLKISPIVQEVVKIDDAIGIYDRLRDTPHSLFGTVFDWTHSGA